MNKTLNILYIFDENYAVYSDVSIVSLLENNKELPNIMIYILDNNISKSSKSKIEKTVNRYNRNLKYINTDSINELLLNTRIPTYRGSSSTNMKLFALDVIEDNIDRLLYLDSDTIITGNLEEILDINLQGNAIGMVLDSITCSHKTYLGFDKNEKYYNAGVILYDINMWRNTHCTEQIIAHVKNIRAHYPATDQDIFNIVFKDNIFTLDLKYNVQPIHLIYDNNTYYRNFGYRTYYNKEIISRAVKEPKVFHTYRYIGEFPWHKNNYHPCNAVFDSYLKLSEWPDFEKFEAKKSTLLKIEKKLYHIMPPWFFIKIFKVAFKFFSYKANLASNKEIQIKSI